MKQLVWLLICAACGLQVLFGVFEMFFARRVLFARLLGTYEATKSSPAWDDAVRITFNMGLYNWFLAAGLAMSLHYWTNHWASGFGPVLAAFFLACMTVAGIVGLLSVRVSPAFIAQAALPLAALALLWQLADTLPAAARP